MVLKYKYNEKKKKLLWKCLDIKYTFSKSLRPA
jgi:hypothetical protein